MSSPDRSRLTALAEAATPGPWFVERGGELNEPFWLIGGVLRDRYGDNGISSSDEATIQFIAAASPDVVLALLAELARLEAERDQAERNFHEACSRLGERDAAIARERAAEVRASTAEAALTKVREALALRKGQFDNTASRLGAYERACAAAALAVGDEP